MQSDFQQKQGLARPPSFDLAVGRIANQFPLLSSERINGQRAKTLRKSMRGRAPPFQNPKNPHAKLAAKPPTFGALFLNFRGVEIALLIIFLEVFARSSLTLAYDNNKKSQKLTFRLRPQTDIFRLVSSNLVLRGGSRRPGRPF